MTWARRSSAPASRLQGVQDFLRAVTLLDVTPQVAERFGELRADLLDRGIVVGQMDLFNASIALVHNLTLVTHNTADYANIPGLTLVDWQIP